MAKAASSSLDGLSYVSSKAYGVMSVKDHEGATTWGLNKCKLSGKNTIRKKKKNQKVIFTESEFCVLSEKKPYFQGEFQRKTSP